MMTTLMEHMDEKPDKVREICEALALVLLDRLVAPPATAGKSRMKTTTFTFLERAAGVAGLAMQTTMNSYRNLMISKAPSLLQSDGNTSEPEKTSTTRFSHHRLSMDLGRSQPGTHPQPTLQRRDGVALLSKGYSPLVVHLAETIFFLSLVLEKLRARALLVLAVTLFLLLPAAFVIRSLLMMSSASRQMPSLVHRQADLERVKTHYQTLTHWVSI